MAQGEYTSEFTGEQIDALLEKVDQRVSTPAPAEDKLITSGGVYTGLAGKTDKVTSPTAGNLPKLKADGSLEDSGKKPSDFVEKEAGKGLSSNDYTDTEKTKLGALPTNADLQTALGNKEDKSNKVTSFSSPTDTQYPSAKLVKESLDTKVAKQTEAVEGHLASFDSEGNPIDSGISKEEIGKSGGVDEGATVGASEGVIDTNLGGSEQSMVGMRRFVGKNGLAEIKRIDGCTRKWNQIIDDTQLGIWAVKSWTLTGHTFNLVSNAQGNAYVGKAQTTILGHKYLLIAEYKTSNAGGFVSFAGLVSTITADNTWRRYTGIKTAVDTSFRVGLQFTAATEDLTGEVRNVNVFDLTLLGIDNLTTVAEVESWLAKNVGLRTYYPYDPGSLLNNDADAIVSRGRNAWDEEWELGGLSETGEEQPSTSSIRAKNLIPAFPSTDYFIKLEASGQLARALCYDSNGNFIGSCTGSYTTGGWAIQTIAGTAFIRFSLNPAYGTSYNNDICINLSDPAFNGRYEPYKKAECKLGLKEIKVKSPNIWDEEWEKGDIDSSGQNTSNGNKIRSKNYIPVTAGTSLYIQAPVSLNVFLFDSDYNLLYAYNQGTGTYMYWLVGVHTIPSGVSYMRFSTIGSTISSYSNNICINLSGWANGRYFPHGILTFNGLDGIDSLRDRETKDTLHKRFVTVDLGDLTWSYQGNGIFTANGNQIPGIKASHDRILVCPIYPFSSASSSSDVPDKSIANNQWTAASTEEEILVKDTSYSNAATFKSAMSGVKIIVELAVEEVYELAEPFNGVYRVFEGGTEEVVNENLAAPFVAQIAYNRDINERLLDLSKPGFCEGLVDTISAGTAQEFLQRQSGGDGVNCIKRIKGKTIAWNQIIQNGDFSDGATGWSGRESTPYAAANGVLTMTAWHASLTQVRQSGLSIIAGHKYYIHFKSANTNAGGFRADLGLSPWNAQQNVFINSAASAMSSHGVVLTANGNYDRIIFAMAGVASEEIGVATASIADVFCVDLTLATLSDLTADQFRALYPELYYAYNAGVLKSNDAAALLTDGFNQWDGTVVANSYVNPSTGETVSTVNYDRTDYIPVIGGQTYYIKSFGYAYAYDADKNFLGTMTIASNLFTLPANAAYVIAQTVYSNHITDKSLYWLNLSWSGYRNGTYEPYWQRVLALRLSELTGIPEGGTEADRVTMFPNGLGGAGSAFDSIFVENGVTKARRRIGKYVITGNENWIAFGSNTYYAVVLGSAGCIENTSAVNCVCDKLPATSVSSLYNGTFTTGAAANSVNVYISASDYANLSNLVGTEIYYILATPIVYTDLQYADGTPFTMPAAILVDNYGKEVIVPPTGATTPSAPFCCDSNYSISIANLVKKLNTL